MQKGTTPFYISGFLPVANNSLIKVPIPNKNHLFSDNKEFNIRSCDSLKSAVHNKGNKFTNMFGNNSPKEDEQENPRPTSLAELCSNVTNIHPSYKNRHGGIIPMAPYPHPSLFNHLFANYHHPPFYPMMMPPQKGGCYGHPCCSGSYAAAMH
jgi:hypothetical protein